MIYQYMFFIIAEYYAFMVSYRLVYGVICVFLSVTPCHIQKREVTAGYAVKR